MIEMQALAGTSSSRRGWLALGVVWTAAFVALALWLTATSTGTLMEQLKALQFWSLEAGVFGVVICAVLLLGELRRDVGWRDAYVLGMLAAASLVLTLGVAPRTNRIFYDEQIYQGIGQNLADLRLAQVCNDGSVDYGRLRCDAGEYNKQPYAYPHLLSLGYRLFGVKGVTAFVLNALAMALTTCALYLLVLRLFDNRDAALFAGLLFVLTPEQLIWSATAAVEPTASMATVLALLAASQYRRSGTAAALAAVAVTLAWAIQFRPESLLVAPVVGALVWSRLAGDLSRVRAWWMGLLFLALATAHIGHLVAVRNIPWGSSGPRFSLAYLPGNLAVNGWFYLWDERYPALFTVLAAAGLLASARDRMHWAMAGYFALYFGIDIVFYAGSYNYGADVRYSLMTFPPLAVLGGLGLSALCVAARRALPAIPWRSVVATAVVFQFMWYAPVVRATTEEGWAARADVRFASVVAPQLPANAYVLTHNPGMFHLWGVNAGQMSRAVANEPFLGYLRERYPGGVYLHWNFWCNVDDPLRQEFCREALGMAEAVAEYEHRERDQRFAFYRLTPPS